MDNILGKNTGVDCHFLLEGIFLDEGLNLCLLQWQADFFTTEPPGKPVGVYMCVYVCMYICLCIYTSIIFFFLKIFLPYRPLQSIE